MKHLRFNGHGLVLHYKDCFHVWWFFKLSFWAMPKHEEFLVCFWISIFSMAKGIGEKLGKESHTFMLGKSQTSCTKFWQSLNMNSSCAIHFWKTFLKITLHIERLTTISNEFVAVLLQAFGQAACKANKLKNVEIWSFIKSCCSSSSLHRKKKCK